MTPRPTQRRFKGAPFVPTYQIGRLSKCLLGLIWETRVQATVILAKRDHAYHSRHRTCAIEIREPVKLIEILDQSQMCLTPISK